MNFKVVRDPHFCLSSGHIGYFVDRKNNCFFLLSKANISWTCWKYSHVECPSPISIKMNRKKNRKKTNTRLIEKNNIVQ